MTKSFSVVGQPFRYVLLAVMVFVLVVACLPHKAFAAIAISAVNIQSNNASTSLAKANNQVGITFTTNQALVISATSTVKILGAGSTLASTTPVLLSGTTYTATTTLGSATNPSDGALTFLIYVVGTGAGNGFASTTASATSDSSAVRLDTASSSISTLTSTSSNSSFPATLAKSGDTVTLTFSSSELISAPSVTIGSHTVTAVSTSTAANTPWNTVQNWTASAVMGAGDSAYDGSTLLFSVAAPVDLASNASTTATPNSWVSSGSAIVLDETGPVITVTGNNPDSSGYSASNGYSDLGATATDAHDGSASVSSSGTVNRLVAGSYTITYTSTDSVGNTSTASRTVTVTNGGGGIFNGSASQLFGYVAPRPQVIHPDGTVEYTDGKPAPASTAGAQSGNVGAATNFTKDLLVGSKGTEVSLLQVYLNAHGYQVAKNGPGSPGNETSMFGGLTKAALIKLQKTNGITPSVGYFGPKTRAFVAAHP